MEGKVWHNFACEGVLAACTVKLPESVCLVCNTYSSASHAHMRFSSPGHSPLELSPQHTSRYVSGNNLIRPTDGKLLHLRGVSQTSRSAGTYGDLERAECDTC